MKLVCLLIFLFTINKAAWSQFYPAKLYSIRDGMPTNAIYDITQSTDGIMWFVTSKGVVNYNSLNWKLFPDSLNLPNSAFSYIKALEDGSVWVAGQNKNKFDIRFFKNDSWHSLKVGKFPAIEDRFTFDVKSIEGGYKIAFSVREIVYIINTNENTLESVSVYNGNDFRSNSIRIYNDDILLSTSKGLQILSDSLKPHPINEEIKGFDDHEILQIHKKNESLYVLGKGWLGLYKNKEFELLSKETDVTNNSFLNKHNLTVDKFGRIFFSSLSAAHYLDKATGKGQILYINGRVFNAQSNSIYVDSENNVWVGDHRGLFKFNVLRFQNYNENIGLANDEVTVIKPYKDQLILANENHLNFLSNKNIIKKIAIEKKDRSRILDIAVDNKENLFIAASSGGLLKYNGDEISPLKWNLGTKDLAVTSVEYINNTLYFSTNLAFFNYNNGRIQKIEDLPYVRNIVPTQDKSELMLCTFNGIYFYNLNTEEIKHINTNSRVYNNIYDITKWNNQYIVATSGGLAVVEDNNIKPVLLNDRMNRVAIYSLFVSNKNQLWMGTNEGVFIWNGKDLINYNRSHGLIGDEVNRNAFLQINKDEIWIGTELGASVYNFDEDISIDIIPQLKISHVETLEGSKLTEYDNQLKYDDNTLEFSFLGVSYFDENQINYRYKLNGFDQDWIFIDNPNSNSVRYTNLPPGKYEFLVETSLDNNNWSVPKSISFTIEKPFYSTYWFIALLVISTLIVLYSIYRIRFYFILENQKKLKEEVNLRTKEIQRMNNEIQAQNEELISQSEEIATNNERLEEIVQDRTSKLKEQNDKLSKYAFMNSHELRGPICRMIGLLNLLKLSKQSEYDKIIGLIHETGMELDAVTRHINKLLDHVDLNDLYHANSIEVINSKIKEKYKKYDH